MGQCCIETRFLRPDRGENTVQDTDVGLNCDSSSALRQEAVTLGASIIFSIGISLQFVKKGQRWHSP
jgi:hypothetical protein